MTSSRPQLIVLLRWPIAVVISSLILGGALFKLLSEPIPIRIEGGLNVDRLVMPSTVTIRADGPLPVKAGVTVDGDGSLKGEQPIRISGPVQVQGGVSARIDGPVEASVAALDQPLTINTNEPLTINTEEPIDVNNEVTNKDITVRGLVTVEEPVDINGAVEVKGKVGARIGL
jgi:hypothetical protein|tara:strand:+ start:388 stop:906 length:519 start_codon:yes stop_codon:yes gene_type:complete